MQGLPDSRRNKNGGSKNDPSMMLAFAPMDRIGKPVSAGGRKVKLRKSFKLPISMILAGLGIFIIGAPACRSTVEPDMFRLYPYLGTVVFVDIEGGFYGILGEQERRFDPINLPAEFRHDGLRVRFDYKPRPDLVSFRMWGEIIEIVRIARELDPGR